jgi:hypothetical protein
MARGMSVVMPATAAEASAGDPPAQTSPRCSRAHACRERQGLSHHMSTGRRDDAQVHDFEIAG